ncbi:Protoheme IX farnesyltransferase, mitochondrial [Cichlidogyrus casuarinus]|uniref:Protoheme IX farnesyltransferase, mitochondrial n=1 Tax=Cichlidogyrus casuarinus TaxID=1844966 RepID=A0ABD2Q0M4_9PLAT
MAYSMILNKNLLQIILVRSRSRFATISQGKLHSLNVKLTNEKTQKFPHAPSENSARDREIPSDTILQELSRHESLLHSKEQQTFDLIVPLDPPSISSSIKSWISNWSDAAYGLSKFRLTSFVVMSAIAGAGLAAPTGLASQEFLAHQPLTLFSLIMGTGLASACANTINQIVEISHDSKMKRTAARVLVTKKVTPPEAAAFALLSGVGGVGLLAFGTNPLVALLGAFNVGLYTCVYTPMKRVTQYNTWIGAVVGAIPPLMGWAAVTGNLDAGSLMLAALLYVWQFPHFMALSWNNRDDYARAGYVMSANVDPRLCRAAALRHAVATAVICLAGAGCTAGCLGPWAGYALGLTSLPANLGLMYYSYKFYHAPDNQSSLAARQLFRMSLFHLPVVITAMLVCTNVAAFY